MRAAKALRRPRSSRGCRRTGDPAPAPLWSVFAVFDQAEDLRRQQLEVVEEFRDELRACVREGVEDSDAEQYEGEDSKDQVEGEPAPRPRASSRMNSFMVALSVW